MFVNLYLKLYNRIWWFKIKNNWLRLKKYIYMSVFYYRFCSGPHGFVDSFSSALSFIVSSSWKILLFIIHSVTVRFLVCLPRPVTSSAAWQVDFCFEIVKSVAVDFQHPINLNTHIIDLMFCYFVTFYTNSSVET
jgi:hypothetical protein